MTSRIETTIRIESWDEKPSAEYVDGTKVAHAVVALSNDAGNDAGSDLAESRDALRSGHMESVLYYRADGTSSYAGVLRLEAELDGRSGSLTAIGEGSYDGTTASSTMRIAEGTGDLAGLTGTVSSSSTHADYPHMPLVLEYELG
jgi:hypothetical protein